MLSIIVLSSDGYSDCWEPFFFLLKKNFPEAKQYEIILSSNNKSFEFEGFNIKSLLHGKETSWSKRLRLSLDYATNDIVMVLVEDFFILSKLNFKIFSNLLLQISKSDKIDHIRLLYKLDKVKTKGSEYQYLDEIVAKSKYRFLYLPGLWKKDVLQKYVVDFETPYMAEKMGDFRSWMLKDGFYAISKEFVRRGSRFYDCSTSGAVIKGKWGPWLPDRLKENNIELDFNKRGFKEFNSNKKARNSIYKNLLLNPKTTFDSMLSIVKLVFSSLNIR